MEVVELPKKKPFVFYYCRDCDMDFLVTAKLNTGNRCFCPRCGECIYVEKVKEVWLERPLNYKRPWTTEEDSIILDGVKLGCSYEEISSSLRSRTTQAVRRRLQRLRKLGVNV